MNNDSEPQQSASINVGDVLYILLKHKWKIVGFGFLGLIAAGVLWFVKKPMFESRAKIMVHYVAERRPTSSVPGESEVVREPETRGAAVLQSEVEILTSMDCVLEAVRDFGTRKFLAAYGGGTNDYQAAGLLLKHLTQKLGGSGVITVLLGHPDPLVAQEALTSLIEAYRRKHVHVHRALEAIGELQAEADQIRVRLAQTEGDLRKEKLRANVISLEETKQDISMQLSSLRSSIFAVEAELAERRAELDLHEKRRAVRFPVPLSSTNESKAATAEVSPEKIELYHSLSSKLSELQKREQSLLNGPFAETSRSVVQVRQQIAETQKAITELGVDPRVLQLSAPPEPLAYGREPAFDVDAARARVEGLEARAAHLRKQRTEVQDQANLVENSEDTIRQLELKKQLEEAKLRHYESNLDKARLDRAIDSKNITNISLVEEPTPAGSDSSKLLKKMGIALFGLFGAGIGLAFAIEMFLDGSLKRAKDVELKSRIPLFVAIPQFGANGRPRLKLSRKALKNGSPEHDTGLVRKGEIAPWEAIDPMFEYYESLRDRVVMSYEGDPRKPKIVGVTSCNRGAGTTRISTGLAAALSRDVQRRVLYIGLEKNKVAVTAFFKGRPESEFAPNIDALPGSSEAEAVPELYTLVRTGHNTAGASIVQSFSDLIPKLRTSDYDYIIFDLPPVSETSGSLRLASQMERTLLVVESEETQKAKVDRVRDLLSTTGTQLSAVLNKTRTYGSRFLTDEA